MKDTSELAYKTRLVSADTWWKRILDVQRPYRANLKKLRIDNVLDVGCGIGRNLQNLQRIDVTAVGVDHNEHSVAEANKRGFEAFTLSDFEGRYDSAHPTFDAILISHVLEHMSEADAASVLAQYLPHLKPGGKVVVITPQESGFRQDPTHVNFVDFFVGKRLIEQSNLNLIRAYSFPFPRWVGKWFPYNEFVVVAAK